MDQKISRGNLRIGIVTNNVHPNGHYEVRVKFPTEDVEDESFWARVCTFGAGPNGRGMFALPEVGDEVLVGFLEGHDDYPIIIATLWSGKNLPSYSNKEGKTKTDRFAGKALGDVRAKETDIRAFSSRANHELIFNDNSDKPQVIIQSGGKHRIVLNDEGKEPSKIEICDGKDENYLLIDTKNKKITLESKSGDILIKAEKTVTIEANTIETKSKTDTNIEAGKNFKLNAKSNIEYTANMEVKGEAKAVMTLKGAKINLN